MNIFLQLLIGLFLADLTTGFFHWFQDTYLDYCTNIPFISEIAKENEMHHYFPRDLLAYSILDNISVSIPLTIILFFIFFIANKKIFTKQPYLMFSFAFFICIGPLIHRICHYRDCESSIIIKGLQNIGIICTHQHHKIHHLTSNEKYCVITPYSNYILDGIYFWNILEYIIYYLTSIRPKKKLSYEDYISIHTDIHRNAKMFCPDIPNKEDIKKLFQLLQNFKDCDNN